MRNNVRGFNLIEILVVLSIFILIVGGVIVALNPFKRFAEARNGERALEVNAIQEALDQYVLAGGTYPLPGVPTAPLCIGTKTWAQIAVTGTVPSARQGHSAVWDTLNSRMLIFGGADEVAAFYNDLYAYTPATNTWASVTPSGAPPSQRREHAAVWDPVGNRMFVFGGEDSIPNRLNNLYSYTFSSNTWALVTPSGTPPSVRLDATAVWDPVNNRMLVFGGSLVGNVMAQDFYSYTPSTNAWASVPLIGTPPTARAAAAMVWDPQNSRFILFGGNIGSGSYSNQLYYYDPSTNIWSQPSITGSLPSAREDHLAVWDTLGNRMLMFGGWNGSTFFQDLWSFSPSTNTWTQLPNNTTLPQPRDEHAGVWDGSKMIMFGGDSGPGNFNDLFQSPGCYDLTPYLVPNYFPKVPEDPKSSSGQVDTGYTIQRDPQIQKILTITAPLAETGQTIFKTK